MKKSNDRKRPSQRVLYKKLSKHVQKYQWRPKGVIVALQFKEKRFFPRLSIAGFQRELQCLYHSAGCYLVLNLLASWMYPRPRPAWPISKPFPHHLVAAGISCRNRRRSVVDEADRAVPLGRDLEGSRRRNAWRHERRFSTPWKILIQHEDWCLNSSLLQSSTHQRINSLGNGSVIDNLGGDQVTSSILERNLVFD